MVMVSLTPGERSEGQAPMVNGGNVGVGETEIPPAFVSGAPLPFPEVGEFVPGDDSQATREIVSVTSAITKSAHRFGRVVIPSITPASPPCTAPHRDDIIAQKSRLSSEATYRG